MVDLRQQLIKNFRVFLNQISFLDDQFKPGYQAFEIVGISASSVAHVFRLPENLFIQSDRSMRAQIFNVPVHTSPRAIAS